MNIWKNFGPVPVRCADTLTKTTLMWVRLTPTESGESTNDGQQPATKYYQLTHDYLVPALRTWLTRKKRETMRVRAELRLAERAASWNRKPESRQLPNRPNIAAVAPSFIDCQRSLDRMPGW